MWVSEHGYDPYMRGDECNVATLHSLIAQLFRILYADRFWRSA